MVKVETGCSLTKAYQYRFINLLEKKSLSELTFSKSTLVGDHILTSHAGDSIWSRLVINSRSAIRATNELAQEDFQFLSFYQVLKPWRPLQHFHWKYMLTIGEFKTNMAIVLHIRELFCIKGTTKKRSKRGETFFYTFCTISFLFPPLRPLSTECAEYAFHGQEALEPARTENREKRHKAGEKGKEREMFLLSLILQYRKMDLLPRKPHWFFFSFFILEFPEHRATITTRILGPCSSYPLWRWERGEKKKVLLAKCTSRYFCPASSPTGVNVSQPVVMGMWTLVRLRFEILGFLGKGSQLSPLLKRNATFFVYVIYFVLSFKPNGLYPSSDSDFCLQQWPTAN